MKKKTILWLPALLLAAFLWAGCGGADTRAATMRLSRSDGTVFVNDENGKGISLSENLSLYSGYHVGTQAVSYAWIGLDEDRLAKMDEQTNVEIQKEDKALEIQLLTGSLFFRVTEPLGADETMDIRTSTMVTGIRGTCGWVETGGDYSLTALLEGSVECQTPDGSSVTIQAGQMARWKNSALEVLPLTADDVPAFILGKADDLVSQLPDNGPQALEPVEDGTQALDGNEIPAGQCYFDVHPEFGLPELPDDGLERTILEAADADELAAILQSDNLSNTEIRLGDGTYKVDPIYLSYFGNLSLVGTGRTRLVVGQEDALILSAYNCPNLLLYGLVLGHDVLPDVACSEPVLSLSYCTEVTIVGCDLFGSGLIGLTGSNTTLTMQNSVIRECSDHGVLWSGSGSALFENCVFSGNGGPLFYLYAGGASMTLNDCLIENNRGSAKYAFFDESLNEDLWNESGTQEIGNDWQ